MIDIAGPKKTGLVLSLLVALLLSGCGMSVVLPIRETKNHSRLFRQR